MKSKTGMSNLNIVRSYLDGTRPFTVVGYTGKQYAKRNVGEQWTDSKGIEWEQKESGPVRVNRVSDIIREARGKEICKCGQEIRWGSRVDNILFRKTGLCANCLIDYETKLRIVGIYNDYEACKLISNEIGFLKDVKDQIEEAIKFFSSDSGDVTAICNSEGFLERWKNTNNDKILVDATRDLKVCKQRIAALSKEKKKFKHKFLEGAKKYKLKSYV